MSILVEQTLNEIQVAGGIYSAKPITTTATGTFASAAISGAFVAGASTLGATGSTTPALNLGAGGPQLMSGTLSGNANPTGITAPGGSIFINLGAGATGPTNRAYINTNGATGWTYITMGA